MISSTDLQNLSIKVNYGKKMTDEVNPSLDLVLFIRQPFFEWANFFSRIYEAFLKIYEGRFTYCADGSGKWKKATDLQMKKPLKWVIDKKQLQQKLLSFTAHCGDGEKAYWCPKAPALDFFLDQVYMENISAYLRLSFPVETNPEEVIFFVQKNVSDLPLHAGYAGYSLLCDESETYNKHWTGAFALRLKTYPGLNHPDAGRAGVWAGDKLAIISWLTFMGKELIHRMGEIENVRKNLESDFDLHVLGSSLCVQAGKAPALGYKKPSSLPLYQKLGHYLSPILLPNDPLKMIGVAGMGKKEGLSWWRRFF